MARLEGTVLSDDKSFNAEGSRAATTDLRLSGQQGYLTNPEGYVGNSAYVRRNLIPVLLESPSGFNLLPNPEVLHGTLKSLVERHAKSITGLTSTLTVEFVANPVGGAGEEQEDVANVTRAKSAPVFLWPEKDGMPVARFIDYWILNLLMDPETKVPRVASYGAGEPVDLLPDVTGMTVLFLEPDATHTKVVKAWLCTNMMPRVGGTMEGQRDLSAAGEALEHSIEFTALTEVGEGVMRLAQKFLDEMNLTGINPNMRPAIVEEVSGDVEGEQTGYADQIAEAKTSFISA